jgi:hypothetical protein
MKRPATKTQWILTIATLVVIFGAAFITIPYMDAYVFGPAKGWFNRTFRVPSVVRASYVEDLDPARAKAQVEKFLSVYESRSGSYGLRRTVVSVEGTPIGKCLVTENGALTFVLDSTRDRNGSRQFSIAHPSSVAPVPAEKGRREDSSRLRTPQFYLISHVSGRGIAF